MNMPLILLGCRTLPALKLHICDPIVCGLRDGDALAVRSVDALLDFMSSGHRPSVCFLLRGEGLQASFALLIGVVDNPRFALNALCGFPFALAYAHCRLLELRFFRRTS